MLINNSAKNFWRSGLNINHFDSLTKIFLNLYLAKFRYFSKTIFSMWRFIKCRSFSPGSKDVNILRDWWLYNCASFRNVTLKSAQCGDKMNDYFSLRTATLWMRVFELRSHEYAISSDTWSMICKIESHCRWKHCYNLKTLFIIKLMLVSKTLVTLRKYNFFELLNRPWSSRYPLIKLS